MARSRPRTGGLGNARTLTPRAPLPGTQREHDQRFLRRAPDWATTAADGRGATDKVVTITGPKALWAHLDHTPRAAQRGPVRGTIATWMHIAIGGGLQGCPLRGVRPRRWRCGCRARTALSDRAAGVLRAASRPASRLVHRPEPTDATSPMRPLVVDHAVRPSPLRSSTASRTARSRFDVGIAGPLHGGAATERGERPCAGLDCPPRGQTHGLPQLGPQDPASP